MNAYVGVFTARLETPWVTSLKEKRAVIRPVMERIKARFPVSAARVAGLDEHGWEQVGFSVIGGDAAWVAEVLDAVERFLRSSGEYRVVVLTREIIVFDGTVSPEPPG
ncbi:DUF503 domain-containing protein [Oceanithermus sp.]|uniref:DUF503 domain-containing protein n=1 Tax=Oceanithermus profundus TaxID=187137 RepID=A0A7C4V4J5_9DEIN|nr:DUF503 domain-containing protein [Oceanithermus sp.]HGY08665.1 DUF503 domain-containing protein [Oceanithermus profundus]